MDTNDSTGETNGWQDSADYDIGDAVPYKLSATLADNVTDYKNYHIIFRDEMETGLTFNKIEKVVLTGNDGTVTELVPAQEETFGYELIKIDDQKFELKITWINGGKKISNASLNGATVEVYFTATLNEQAILGSQGNVNKSKLIYSCNSNVNAEGKIENEEHKDDKTEKETDWDSVICFTYKIEVNKIEKDEKESRSLTGAEFELKKLMKDGSYVTISGNDRVTVSNGTTFTFKGLDDGTYVLTETKTPDGYKPIDPITIIVEAGHQPIWDGTEATWREVLYGLTGTEQKPANEPLEGDLDAGTIAPPTITLESDGTFGTLTGDILNESKLTSASVWKIWDDDNNRDGKRPPSLTVYLLADGVRTGDKVTLREGNNWSDRIDGLQMMKHGEPIKYTWIEDNPGNDYYPIGNSTKGKLTTLTNKRDIEKTSIKVTKNWDDQKNAAGMRKPIQGQLYANDKPADVPKAIVTLSTEDGASHTWENLPKYANGKEIAYTVAELAVPEGYTMTQSGSAGSGFVIKNTLTPGALEIQKKFDFEPLIPEEPDDEPMDIPVVKSWDDAGNKDGNRPTSVTVHLLADGKEVAKAELNEGNGWAHIFTGMPKKNGEEKIEYTVTEDPVEWYEAEIDGFYIRNVYKPELTSVIVQKVWDDHNNEAGMRPSSIRMTLSNGTSVILSDANGWTAVVDNLPTRLNGSTAVYTWTEQEVVGYRQVSRTVSGNVTTFTNHFTNIPPYFGDQPKPDVPGGDWYAIFEEYNTALGGQILINHVGDCFD